MLSVPPSVVDNYIYTTLVILGVGAEFSKASRKEQTVALHNKEANFKKKECLNLSLNRLQ